MARADKIRPQNQRCPECGSLEYLPCRPCENSTEIVMRCCDCQYQGPYTPPPPAKKENEYSKGYLGLDKLPPVRPPQELPRKEFLEVCSDRQKKKLPEKKMPEKPEATDSEILAYWKQHGIKSTLTHFNIDHERLNKIRKEATEPKPEAREPGRIDFSKLKTWARRKELDKYDAQIRADIEKHGQEKTMELWHLSLIAITRLQNRPPGTPEKPPREKGERSVGNAKSESAKEKEKTRVDHHPPIFLKEYILKSPGSAITLRVTGNLLKMSKDDREFVLNIVESLDNYKTLGPTTRLLLPVGKIDNDGDGDGHNG